MTTGKQAALKRQADQLYERYVRSLEAEHAGEFIAVAADARTVLAPDLITLADEAVARLGPASFASKIGEKSVGRWR